MRHEHRYDEKSGSIFTKIEINQTKAALAAWNEYLDNKTKKYLETQERLKNAAKIPKNAPYTDLTAQALEDFYTTKRTVQTGEPYVFESRKQYEALKTQEDAVKNIDELRKKVEQAKKEVDNLDKAQYELVGTTKETSRGYSRRCP